MKTLIRLLIFFFLTSFSEFSFGQKTMLNIGGLVAFPSSSGGLSNYAGTGFGGNLSAETSFGKSVYGTISFGYTKFKEKVNQGINYEEKTNFSATTIFAGLKIYLEPKPNQSAQGFYLSIDLGVMPTTTHFSYSDSNTSDYKFKESGLCVSPGLGYKLGPINLRARHIFNLSASGFSGYYTDISLAYSLLPFSKKQKTSIE